MIGEIRVAWALLPLVVFLLAAGCAEERPPVDRVQPFALDKALFVGENLSDPADNPEFWTSATLVDVSYGATQESLFTSTYAQKLSRIKWHISEDLLVARLAHERIEGTDGKGIGKKTDEGVVVAAFKIESHFDIVHDYNPTTGEQLNVVEENDSDRPWYQRKYMRVDFSKNLNEDSYDLDMLSMIGIYDGIEYESLSYFVDDPTHPDAPVFELEDGYFDITVKAFAKPQTIDLSHLGWGIDSFPACWLEYDFLYGTYPSGSCSPAELTIRHSFRKVEDFDFEPVEWDGERFQAYGAFYLERFGYNRNYGMSDQHWHRFLTHYQLWKRSHYYSDPELMQGAVECYTPDTTPHGADPHRDENGDGTEDECEAVGNGSRCDTFTQKCTLPFQERTPTVIPWYYSQGSDPDYYESTDIATHNWDVALRHAVMAARYVECNRVGGQDCLKNYPVYFGQATDHADAIALALEVDDCRNGLAYADKGKDPAKCAALADELGAKRGYDDGVIALAKMDEIVVLCHSPVLANDPPACGDRRLPEGLTQADCDAVAAAISGEEDGGDEVKTDLDSCNQALRVRRGDIRFHQINVIEEPQNAMPWGIYVDSEDPLNGQKVAASVNVWSAVTDLWSQKVIDQLRYVKGELTTADVTEGTHVDDWARAVEAAAQGGAFPKLSREQVNRRAGEFATGKAQDVSKQAKEFAAAHPQQMAKARQIAKEFKGVKAYSGAASTWAPMYTARRRAAAGSQVEASLMNRMMQQFFGVEGMHVGEGLMELVSPMRGGNPSVRRELRKMKRNALAKHGTCVLEAAHAPMDLASIADVLEAKFGKFNAEDPISVQAERAEAMRDYVARRVHMGAVVHEMGHSVGMRHNFVSSGDAWNYRPQYWQLRTRNGTVDTLCTDLNLKGEDCVGPRYFDTLTQEEKDNLIHMFMQSSVMDYPGETTQDFMDLGPFDFAAARIFYGDAVAVHADDSYNVGTIRGTASLEKTDDFGGILGISHWFGENAIHYSELQKNFELISECKAVDPLDYVPARYNEGKDGTWHPVLDGRIVQVDGSYSRCRNQPVDYTHWNDMRGPTDQEFTGWYPPGHAIDSKGRTRVPYGFATDSWADLGNVSVYTNDNGADVYEIFNFLITQHEVNHIFDNYRRGRQEFSVRAAADRSLWRYNEKVRDGAKGLGLMRNWLSDAFLQDGVDPDGYWAVTAPDWYRDNVIASGLVFDHFTAMATRPEAGPHYQHGADAVLRSNIDPIGEEGPPVVLVPNGVTGKFGNVNPAGRLIENRYAEGMGEYNFELIANAGSYYDKINAAMLLTESVDNFISDTRQDFVDPRYRAVSIADLFPDGYRRFLGNMLTNDEWMKGTRIAVDDTGRPILDDNGYPAQGIGWTSWWGEQPQVCFPGKGTTVCSQWGDTTKVEFPDEGPEYTAVVDAQLGWEEQKFFIAWTLLYLPENEQQKWVDMIRMWELGKDSDPGFENRIELHLPTGKVYVAKTYGTEQQFGFTVQKGVAARVLEYANELLVQAYQTEAGPDLNGDGYADWYLPMFNQETGEPLVLYDSFVAAAADDWRFVFPYGVEGCNEDDNSECTCSKNRACMALQQYAQIPFFIRQTLDAYEMWDPEPDGIW